MTVDWFPVGGDEWLRCQFHSHTTNSDGIASPPELVEHYARAGYDVVAITDHWHVTHHEDSRVLVIASSELSARVGENGEADVLALGADRTPQAREHFASVEAAAAWVLEHGGVPFLAHPYWSGLDRSEFLGAPSLCGIEVFNGGCELEDATGAASAYWDSILRAGRLCPAIACDDCHHPGEDSLLGWTMVRARERSRDAVCDALRAGAFYGSAGPEIQELTLGAQGIDIRCSPARAVTLRAAPWEGARALADPDRPGWRSTVLERDAQGAITAARLQFPEQHGWGRVEVLGVDHTVAWSNPRTLPTAPGGPDSNWG